MTITDMRNQGWAYPLDEPDFWTFPANDLTIGRIRDAGVEYPVSGDLSTTALHEVDNGRPAPHFRNESLQQVRPMA